MANIKIAFLGTERSGTEITELECYVNVYGEVFISISDKNTQRSGFIALDVSTSIKLAKTLRTCINEIKSYEV
ncbi:hypothetical protein [Winogradskyella sp.]|uniref:hypothetical protein n=1 Tax=Winogradskyella sp. TaxID=1883156 RepID=UPI0025F4CC0C|nr:hypothetical protein [Winogradskyella sp.]MBT8243828.1 hypothetical protein [Winogradskyella sp.]